jgi:Ca2+-binding EF-hand superfamily protein
MANNNGLLSGILAGLNNTYAYLKSQNPDGVTIDGINDVKNDKEKVGMMNNTFASYLQNNFAKIDKDGDGIINDGEMEALTTLMSRAGLTKEELIQMYASGASGLSQDTVEMITKYFDEIDANKDGRVTSEEISAFNFNSVKQEKMDEYAHKRATDMSTFYGGDSSSSVDSYSMLSYRYKKSK